MSETKYTKDHEWVRKDGDHYIVGITDHAQSALGDVVFVDLPKIGRKIAVSEACAVVESVKAASDIYAPLTGEVTAINEALVADPALVNQSPEKDAWFFKMTADQADDFAGLMSESDYRKIL